MRDSHWAPAVAYGKQSAALETQDPGLMQFYSYFGIYHPKSGFEFQKLLDLLDAKIGLPVLKNIEKLASGLL